MKILHLPLPYILSPQPLFRLCGSSVYPIILLEFTHLDYGFDIPIPITKIIINTSTTATPASTQISIPPADSEPRRPKPYLANISIRTKNPKQVHTLTTLNIKLYAQMHDYSRSIGAYTQTCMSRNVDLLHFFGQQRSEKVQEGGTKKADFPLMTSSVTRPGKELDQLHCAGSGKVGLVVRGG